ncbi:unnamed protein product [Arctogadus glacialis]
MQLALLKVHIRHQNTSSKFDSSQPGATKRRRRTTEVAPDPVDAALLERLQELRREERDSKNVFSTFTAYLNTVLQDLPATDGKKLMKEIQQLMLTYSVQRATSDMPVLPVNPAWLCVEVLFEEFPDSHAILGGSCGCDASGANKVGVSLDHLSPFSRCTIPVDHSWGYVAVLFRQGLVSF